MAYDWPTILLKEGGVVLSLLAVNFLYRHYKFYYCRFFSTLGLMLIALGIALNSLAISFNDGKMPVKPPHQESFEEEDDLVPYSTDTNLKLLIDRIPIGNFIYSIGDIFIYCGSTMSLIVFAISSVLFLKLFRQEKNRSQ